MTLKLLVLASYDSQLKVVSYISKEFLARGWRIDVRIPTMSARQISSRQLNEFSSFSRFEYCGLSTAEALRDCMSYDAILLVLGGQMTQRLCAEFYSDLESSTSDKRPVLVTGFVGVGLFDTCIGYQRRLLSDVLFLNAEKDLQDCQSICTELGVEHGGLVVSGLPFLGRFTEAKPRKEVHKVVFAGQPDVPVRPVERLFLLQKMLDYARRFPERRVYFKPRHRPEERTLHKTNYHYETLIESFINSNDIPKNFEISYGPMSEYLSECQVLVTISSTAILEAIEHGIHGVLLDDLGISEDYGNHYFIGSGLLCGMDRFLEDDLPMVNPSWLAKHIHTSGDGAAIVYDATIAAMDENASIMHPPYQLEKILAQAHNRLQIESQNRAVVRDVWKFAKFFLRRAVKERRIF